MIGLFLLFLGCQVVTCFSVTRDFPLGGQKNAQLRIITEVLRGGGARSTSGSDEATVKPAPGTMAVSVDNTPQGAQADNTPQGAQDDNTVQASSFDSGIPDIPAPPADNGIQAKPVGFGIHKPPAYETVLAPPADNATQGAQADNTVQAPSLDKSIPAPPVDNGIQAKPVGFEIPKPPTYETVLTLPDNNATQGAQADNTVQARRLDYGFLANPAPPADNATQGAQADNTVQARRLDYGFLANPAPPADNGVQAKPNGFVLPAPSADNGIQAKQWPYNFEIHTQPPYETVLTLSADNATQGAQADNTVQARRLDYGFLANLAPPADNTTQGAQTDNTVQARRLDYGFLANLAPPADNATQGAQADNTVQARRLDYGFLANLAPPADNATQGAQADNTVQAPSLDKSTPAPPADNGVQAKPNGFVLPAPSADNGIQAKPDAFKIIFPPAYNAIQAPPADNAPKDNSLPQKATVKPAPGTVAESVDNATQGAQVDNGIQAKPDDFEIHAPPADNANQAPSFDIRVTGADNPLWGLPADNIPKDVSVLKKATVKPATGTVAESVDNATQGAQVDNGFQAKPDAFKFFFPPAYNAIQAPPADNAPKDNSLPQKATVKPATGTVAESVDNATQGAQVDNGFQAKPDAFKFFFPPAYNAIQAPPADNAPKDNSLPQKATVKPAPGTVAESVDNATQGAQVDNGIQAKPDDFEIHAPPADNANQAPSFDIRVTGADNPLWGLPADHIPKDVSVLKKATVKPATGTVAESVDNATQGAQVDNGFQAMPDHFEIHTPHSDNALWELPADNTPKDISLL